MKLLSKILCLLFFHCAFFAQSENDLDTVMQSYVATWQDTYVSQLTVQEIVTITDMLLLSYQVVEASVAMSQARLVIQTELFNIVTLSINDTFDAQIQAQNNDLTLIKGSVATIEQAQEKIKFACNALKTFGPLLVNINPTAIQVFISNLKNVILNWAKMQHGTMNQLNDLQQELVTTTQCLANVKKIFEAITTATEPVEHNKLLQGANGITDFYKNCENMFANLTIIRKDSIASFNKLLTLFFKNHYQILYNQLKLVNQDHIKLLATSHHTLPEPEDIFIL